MELQYKKDFFTKFSLVILVLLLLEFLYPLHELQIIGELKYFVIFIILLAGIKLFSYFPFFIRFLIGLVYIVYVLKTIYFNRSANFFRDLKNMLIEDVFLILSFDFLSISFVSQTLLLFLFLWLVTGVIFERLAQKQLVIIFFILTIIFLVTLDTFTLFDGKMAIIRVLGVSFLYFGLRTFFQNIRFTKVDYRSAFMKRWIVILLSFILFSLGLGWFIPKLQPQLPDPVAFITTLVSQEEGTIESPGGYVKEVGLGENDGILGGPLVGNNEVVFQVVSPSRDIGYFRVESKDYYTGNGWMAINEMVDPPANQFVQQASLLEDGVVELKETKITISGLENQNYFPYQNFTLYLDSATVNYDFTEMNSSYNRLRKTEEIQNYTNSFYRVKMEQGLLRNAPKATSNLVENYTQLPETLPQEVINLAEEITFGISNDYDKVVAIESYLKSGIFSYDTINVPYATGEKDYVYEFLFETRRGYCVNFSTAMVVLLRAMDIPANWVKGYVQGDIVDTTNAGEYIYEVTNNNAHAWVEVYFEGIGWIPFDPTIGFNTNISIVNEIFTIEELLNNPNPEEQSPEKETPQVEKEEKSTVSTKEAFYKNPSFFIAVVVIFILQVIVLYIYRLKWLPYYYIWRVKKYKHNNKPDRALHFLLIHLRRLGFEKNPEETLSDFGKRIDEQIKIIDFKPLVNLYTRWLYMKDNSTVSEDILPVWEEVMKKLSELD